MYICWICRHWRHAHELRLDFKKLYMANRKKKTSKKKEVKVPFWADERKKKIAGLFFLLLAMFLAVAFVSYIFTWKEDQDKVLNFHGVS